MQARLPGLVELDAGNPGPLTGAGNHTWLLTGQVPTLVDAGVGTPPIWTRLRPRSMRLGRPFGRSS